MKGPLLSILMLLSISAYSQNTSKIRKHEIGVSAGASFLLPKYNPATPGPMIALNYVFNNERYQFGATVEGSRLNNGNYVYFIPAVVANRKFNESKSYLYVGATTGVFIGRNTMFNAGHTGIVLGLQGGYVLNVGSHISFTSQVGIRAIYAWYYDGILGTVGELLPHIPITIGIRYRF